jgi:hypothetical protein
MVMKRIYVILNSSRQNLSGFYPNAGDRKRFLVYRENDYITFSTKTEAKSFLKHIQFFGVGKNLIIKESVQLR